MVEKIKIIVVRPTEDTVTKPQIVRLIMESAKYRKIVEDGENRLFYSVLHIVGAAAKCHVVPVYCRCHWQACDCGP